MKFIKKLVRWSKGITIALLFVILSSGMVYSAPDNPKYKQWCMDTFFSGAEIYEAYKVVSFDVEYAADALSFPEYWQKPSETLKLKKGDCEDAVILFSSLVPNCNENIRLLWGYLYEKGGSGKAKHVWVELISKTGFKYILEAFKGDWDGIVKSEIDANTLIRDEIISLPQCLYNEILHIFTHADSNYDEEEHELVIEYLSDLIKSGKEDLLTNEAYGIFRLLHGMINRVVTFAEKN